MHITAPYFRLNINLNTYSHLLPLVATFLAFLVWELFQMKIQAGYGHSEPYAYLEA